MADLQRPKKYLRPAYNPARFPEHHLLYKELIPYYDFLHNIGFTNLPSQLNIPQTGLHLPISSSPSHRTLFTPLELRYIAGSSPASSSAKSGSYSNVSNVNPISYSNVSGNPNAPTERDVLPSDALRHLYRLAERVYSHLNVVMDGKANGTSPTTGTKGQNGKLTGDKSIEITARPAARDGSMLAPGRYSTETRRDLESSGSIDGRGLREPSISDSVSSLYSQNTLANSTLIDETESFYGSMHDREANSTKIAALSAAFEKAQNQLAHERSAREEAESVISALRGEVGLLTGKLERTDAELLAARERERELVSQHKALNASVHGLKSQLDSEPAWAAALRADVLASVHGLSSTTAHSFTGISKDLKHQHHEITQLGERTSQLASSQETVVREATHNVQHHLSGKLDSIATEIVTGHKHSMSAISSLEKTIKHDVPALSTAVKEVKTAVSCVDENLGRHETSSHGRHTELKKILHQSSDASTSHHKHTEKLVKGLDDKLQHYIATSTEVAYANVASRPKTTSDDEESHPGQTAVAVESLKMVITASLSAIQKAIERQHTDVTSLMSQVSSQANHHEAVSKTSDSTSTLLKELHSKVSTSEESHSTVISALETMQQTLTSISASSWFEQGVETCGLSKKDDVISISNALAHLSAQLQGLSGHGNAIPITLADLMTQLSDLSARLASVEVEVQGAATAAIVVGEISTIKSVRSLEHQADMAAGERMREAVMGLDEFVRGQLDQVNAALDEQQSRLVSIQSVGKQHAEDSKAIALMVEENSELLRSIELQDSQRRTQSSESFNGVHDVLDEIKNNVIALHESDKARVQMLYDAPPPVNDDIKELCKSMKEHGDILQDLPQRVHTGFTDKHDTLLARNAEVMVLLTALSSSLALLSKDTQVLKETVTKVDSALVESHTSSTERSTLSNQEISSVAQTVIVLEKEILAIRERLFSVPIPSGSSDPTFTEQSSTLVAKLDAVMVELTGVKAHLGDDIANTRTQSDKQIQQLAASLEELRSSLEKLRSAPDEGVSALRSVIERQSADLLSVKDQVSNSQTVISTGVTEQFGELTALVQSISFTEILERLEELGGSITNVQALVVDSKSDTTTSNAEVLALLNNLSSSVTQLSSHTQELKETVTKVDSALVESHTYANERSTVSGKEISSVVQIVSVLEKEIHIIRERLFSLPVPSGDSDSAVTEQSAVLVARLDAVMAELTGMKTHLHEDIAHTRIHSDKHTQQLSVTLEELRGALEQLSNTPDENVIALRSVIEKQSTDLLAVKDQVSSSQTTSSTEVAKQLGEITTLVQSISFAEVLEHLRELGVSVTDVRGLIVKSKSDTSTSNTEVLTLLNTLLSSLVQLSDHTQELKETVTKVDSTLVESHSSVTERSAVSEREISSVVQTMSVLEKEILAIRERLFSLPVPSGGPDSAIAEQSAALLAKLDAVMAELTGMKTHLGEDITKTRTQSDKQTQQLTVSLEELRISLEKLSSTPDEGVAALRSVIEKQSSDLLAVKDQVSSSQTAISTGVNEQISELTTLVQGISFVEVLEHLKELGISVTDIRGLIEESSTSNTSTSTNILEIQKMLEAYSHQFGQVLQNGEGHSARHDAVIALFDQNHSKISEVYEGIQTNVSSTKELISQNHTSTLSSLEKISTVLEAHNAQSKEHCAEIIKVTNDSQQYLSERGDKQGSDIYVKLSDLSQSFVELLSAHTFGSQSLREGVTQLGDSNSRLNGKMDARFKETVDALNQGLEALRQEIPKEPAQIKSLLVMLQERIGSLAISNEERQQVLTDSLKDDLSVIHKGMIPFNDIVTKSRDNGRLIYLAEERKDGEEHYPGMEDQLHRMEQIQHSLEGFVSNHHCNGCNCRGGYDSSQASPLKQRRNLSQFGSDTTGLSPLPYIEQTFEVPSPSEVRRETREIEVSARPYSLDEEDVVTQSPLATTGPETVDLSEKSPKFSFPAPQSRGSSTTGGPTSTAEGSSGAAGANKKEHHHKHHDDREISNPFELFARRPRKSSHKPSEGSEEPQDAGSQQRPRVKSSSTAPMRTSIGSGKSQRTSLLGSALLSAVSDNSVPTTSTRKRTTSTSGGLHRLSSLFGKHHHHHEEEGEAEESTATNKGVSVPQEHEHDSNAKGQGKDGKDGSAC